MPKLLVSPTANLVGDVKELLEWVGEREMSTSDMQLALVHLIHLYYDDVRTRKSCEST